MNCKSRIPCSRGLALLIPIAIMLIFATTPGYAATRLLRLEPNELHGGDTQPYRGLKVCLVVKDARHDSVVKTQMCGLMRNSYGKAMWISVLKNPETLDSILAYSIADSLEFAGYEVVKVYPERPDRLSGEERDKPSGMKADIKLAKKSQPKSARGDAKTFRDLEAFGEGVTFSKVPGKVAAQGDDEWTNGADAVLEITIEQFTSDIIIHAWTVEVLAWSAVTLAVAPGESSHQEGLATTEAHGWGVLQGGGASKKTYKRALDMSYRMLVNKIETVFLSDEFFAEVKVASGADGQAEHRTESDQSSIAPTQADVESDPVQQSRVPSQSHAEPDPVPDLRAELEERMKNAQP